MRAEAGVTLSVECVSQTCISELIIIGNTKGCSGLVTIQQYVQEKAGTVSLNHICLTPNYWG